MQYAKATVVSVEKSRAEIEAVLTKYGARQFGYAADNDRGIASIQFAANERHVRFILSLPKRGDKQFLVTPRKQKRSDEDAYRAWEQACRQRWRALVLCIKAKLESVECGISEFESEFLAHIVLPGGRTVEEFIRPQIEQAYTSGEMPPGISGLLPEMKTANG